MKMSSHTPLLGCVTLVAVLCDPGLQPLRTESPDREQAGLCPSAGVFPQNNLTFHLEFMLPLGFEILSVFNLKPVLSCGCMAYVNRKGFYPSSDVHVFKN